MGFYIFYTDKSDCKAHGDVYKNHDGIHVYRQEMTEYSRYKRCYE